MYKKVLKKFLYICSSIIIILLFASNLYATDSDFKILGDENVVKPIVGESIAVYDVIVGEDQNNLIKDNVKFYLDQKIKGISISQDGKLRVLPSAKVGKIYIKAVIDDNHKLALEVNISESLILNSKDSDGVSITVANTNEVKKVVNEQNFLYNTKSLILLRTIVIMVIFLTLGFYLKWRIKWKKESTNSK